MLEKTDVRRFQKHKKRVVKYGPRVTVLVGETDAGKSSYLRALQFLFFSKWKPAYHRHGAKTTTVTAWIDGRKLTRKKGRGVNAYYIDGKKLSAVGKNGVPDEVKTLLNLTPANVQSQLDPPFWFSETPGAISKKLNKIVNLEKIDEALANAGAGVRDLDRRVKDAEEEVAATEKAAADTAWIDSFVAKGETLLALQEMKDRKEEEVQELESLVKQVRRARRDRTALERAASAGRKAVLAGRGAHATRADVVQLESLIAQVKGHRKLSKVKLPDIDHLKRVRLDADEVAETCSLLEGLIGDVKAARRERLLAKMELVAVADKIQTIKKRVKKCPVCGSLVSRSETSTHGHKGRHVAAKASGGR